ncbi:MAG: transcriptional repressor [candidate division Zixibacteria bacterium]|nr:transcriptional repressor [candidate division Zixibacteria bacterium]
MVRPVETFLKYLDSKHLKLTRERKAVLEEVFFHPGHLEAEELTHTLRSKKSRVSRATIYRTLELLVDSGIVRKIDLGHGHSHYEHILGHTHHDHLVCLKCGKVIEFTDKKIERLQTNICQKSRFQEISHTVQIFGYCKDCR